MKTPVSLGAVWVAFLAVTLLILLAPAPAQACDRSSLQVVSAQLVEGEWEVKIKVCIGAGVTGSRKGADDGTGSWGLWVEGPSPIASFEPAQLVGPYTGGALIGQILSPTSASWMIAPDLPGCNDPNGLDGPYNCKHNATTALLFANSNPRKTYTCVTSAAECGPARSECNLITMRFAQKPNALRAFGIEGAGNPVGGCYPNPDMAVVMGTDYDVDGVFDSDDRCPGADDRIDSDLNQIPDCGEQVDIDGDSVPDTDDALLCPLHGPDADGDGIPDVCDVCASDVHNDSDADGTCDSVDPCPFQAFVSPGADGRCGSFNGCGIQSASAVYGAGSWHVTTEICSTALNDGARLKNSGRYTDNLLLAVYGAPTTIASFAPAQFPLDDFTLAPGVLVDAATLADPAFASRSDECYLYRRSSAGCASPGDAPAAGLYYGVPTPLVSIDGNAVATPPICRTVSFDTAQAPTQLRAFGLDGNGDLQGGCSYSPQASIAPTLVDGDADGDGVSDSRDACPGDFYNDRDGDGSCDSADSCPLDAQNDVDGDRVCGNEEPGCELDPNNDLDADGVCAPADSCPLDAQNDADGDGLCADVDQWDDCNDAEDADQDGTPDACDVCPRDYFNDSDGDGSCDSVDPCPVDRLDDRDTDGACDSLDACPLDSLNDADQDGICGDVDPCPRDLANDADGDGICESADNCPGVSNADQANKDGDSYGNACEPDADNDGRDDDADNCPLVANPTQLDSDSDGRGDACDDLDDDHDGVENGQDSCPRTMAGEAVDRRDGCSIAQRCNPAGVWKNHGAYVACVTKAALVLVLQHSLSVVQAGVTIEAAARSHVGKK